MDVVVLSETIGEILKHIDSLKTSSSSDSLKTTSSSGIGLLKGYINQVKVSLESIQSTVKILDVDVIDKEDDKVCLRNLKNAVNDLSDLVEDLYTDPNLPKQSSHSFFRSNSVKDRYKDVQSQIQDIVNLQESIAKLPKQASVKAWEDIKLNQTEIGREKEKKEIIDQLVSLQTKRKTETTPEESHVVIIPVVTIVEFEVVENEELVHLICNDEKVKARFGSQIFVDGEIPQTDVINNDLTNCKDYLVVVKNLKTENGEDVLEKLMTKLQERTIDGVKRAILITTRSKLMANNITTTTRRNTGIYASFASFKPHVLRGLNENESWSLFKSIRGGDVEENGMERKIVMDCGGVPFWIKFTAEFMKKPSGAATTEDVLKKEFLKELKLYYNKFPALQKMCFAFCSLFPRNHLIDVERLMHLWRAEGFVMDVDVPTAEAKLRGCFNDLVEKPIFKDMEEDEGGIVTRCRMQPLMHDLARFVSDQEENITVDPEGERVHEGVLRASFDFSLDVSRGIPPSLFSKAENLRAILLWKTQTLLPKEGETSTSTCDLIFKTFKTTLRMLDLHDMGIKTIPNSIGEMNNLRYLNLSFNTMEKLPSAITKLSNLQTLKLSQCYLLKELPKHIDQLTKLNHLEIDGCLALTHMPSKIRKLGESLQTLSLFVVSKDDLGGLDDLKILNNLRGHLEISHLETPSLKLSRKDTYLNEKKHLKHLTLRWDHKDVLKEKKGDNSTPYETTLDRLEPPTELTTFFLIGYKGKTLSDWFSSLKCLVKLTLYDCTNCTSLPQLDQLAKLRFLELLRLDNLKCISKNTIADEKKATIYFPSLVELTISDCPNLTSWWTEHEEAKNLPYLACLSKLHVSYCPKLICMPLFPDLDEELVLVGSSMKPLHDTIEPATDTITQGTIRCAPFSKLKSLKISNVEQKPPQDPQNEWIKYFNSLEKLDIKEWKHSLPNGFRHLTSLQSLNIESCQELDLDLISSTHEWEGLKNLCSLAIREIPKLEHLPSGVVKVTSLKDLELHNCHDMTSLSEEIDGLKSLDRLVISNCNKLASLPKALEKMKHLKTLIILDCTLLLPRCQPVTGDDWPQIKHIENKQVTETNRGL